MNSLIELKKNNIPISMITVYDAAFAKMASSAQIDILLVGDSMANVVLGLPSTRDILLDELLSATRAVRRGAPSGLILGDMPFESEKTPELALINAQKFIEAGATAVKIEGYKPEVFEILQRHNIPFVGHLGLLPQTAKNYKQTAQSLEEQALLLEQALQIEKFKPLCIVLEHVPSSFGKQMSEALNVPVIGIGAGSDCDGQVMVLHDILGLGGNYVPPIAKRFINAGEMMVSALSDYQTWVKTRGSL
jgi:3-methyl-2-oxobutanoate hydroxymethyltransferase